MDINKAQGLVYNYFSSQAEEIKSHFTDTTFREISAKVYLKTSAKLPLVATARASSYEFLDFDFIESERRASIVDAFLCLKKKLTNREAAYEEARAKKLIQLHKEAAAIGYRLVKEEGL